MSWLTAQVERQIQWSDSLQTLLFNVELPAHQAGQFVRIAPPEHPEMARPYSLVSIPGEPHEVLYRHFAAGTLTPWLSQLKKGDLIWVNERINGHFLLPDTHPPHRWWLSSGTGIGPFLAFAREQTLRQNWSVPTTLVHSISDAADICYLEAIEAMVQAANGRFQYCPYLTQPKGTVRQPRLGENWVSGALQVPGQVAPPNLSQDEFMICGSGGFVKSMCDALAAEGVTRASGRVIIEPYGKLT